MKKILSLLTLFIAVSLLFFSCGGGGGGGKGKGNGGDEGQTVRLSFDVISSDGNFVSYKDISADWTNPLPSAKYYYKATPKWKPKDGIVIEGVTNGFVQFNPASFSDDFSLGKWEFEVEVRSDTANKVILYKTGTVSPIYVDANTKVITVNVDKQMNGTGYVTVDIYAPTIADDEKVVFYYGKFGGAETSIPLEGTKITEGDYAGFTEFKYVDKNNDNKLALPAGIYIFRAEYSYTYEDDTGAVQSVDIENGNVTHAEVFGDGEVAVTGTIEGNQNTTATLSIDGIKVMGVTVKAVKSADDDTEILSTDIIDGESRVYKAIPTTGKLDGSNWISYVNPDSYQWYVNGEAVAGATLDTFTLDSKDSGVNAPGVNYVYCLVSKANAGVVQYAAGAGKVLVVRPVN